MAYTIQAAFDQFFESINLAGDHRETATARKKSLISLLGHHFNILESFDSGSISHFTALKGKADLDIIVALHYSRHVKDKSPTELLQSIRDALGKYRNQVRKNGQAVTLYYDTWPNVDIVPVSRSIDNAGNITHYNVPDANKGTWIESNPKAHSKLIDSRSGACGGNFRKIIKMMKSWNQNHSSYLQSYHIEVMAVITFNTDLSDLPWNVLQFFKSCHELVASPLWYGMGYADTYLSFSDREEVKKRLATAEKNALMAWYYGKEGKIEDSLSNWKQVFGDTFPSYG